MGILDSRVAELKKLLASSDYKSATRAIDLLRAKIGKAKKEELAPLAEEKEQLFASLRKKNPAVYETLRIEEKTLSEELVFRTSGARVVID